MNRYTNHSRRIRTGAMLLLFCCAYPLYAADSLHYNLTQCREMALTKSTSAKFQEEIRLAAEYNRKAALAAMFPHITANGSYMWNSANAHLLANSSDFSFGTATVNPDGTASFTWSEQSGLGKLADEVSGTILEQPVRNLEADAGQRIADAYQTVYDKMTLDLTHIVVAQVGITQPIYTGGRITQLYKIARSTENIATIESEAKHDDIIYSVDEAYWRVVSVSKKKQLAEQYYNLLCRLENDVKEALTEGVATQSDLLNVATKRGEAEVKKLQAENGLRLSNMALAQVCGLPLNSVFSLDESGLADTQLALDTTHLDAAVANRAEIRLLQESNNIAQYNAKLMAAGLQPNIVASAGYIYTNPNVDNGFSSNWDGKGFFSAGVVVNIPIAHADDILRYKAAKHAANAAALKTEEAREMLTLQTTQANQKLTEAQQKIVLAQLTRKNAEEVLRMAQESYDAGMITSSELMQAQTLWLSAATDLVDAEAEAKTTETMLRKYLRTL
ncbi:MAG: TolC family protein [Paludibacteraceae bacterium]|nr:TolC family protein [Paludibacteraceae bacterium]